MQRANYWREFVRREDLETAVRAIVDPAPFHQPFESALISDLIVERHYFCRLHGLRPTVFKKTREDPRYRFYGYFEMRGWHPVSWTKCLQPPPSREQIIGEALRQSTEGAKTAFRRGHPLCQRCGRLPSVETHHAEPTFQELLDRIFAAVTPAEIESAIAPWNWFETQTFALPPHHPIQRLFDELHQAARLEALCKPCHREAGRKAVGPDERLKPRSR